jgi:hypothetical protein
LRHERSRPGDDARRLFDHLVHVREKALDFLGSCGAAGATDAEGRAALGMLGDAYTSARCGLVSTGYVVDSGRKRPNPSGIEETVWRVATTSEFVCFTDADDMGGGE